MARKPKRHHNPNRAIYHRKADPKRTARRIEARMAFLTRITKEMTIGPDPMYDHSRGRSETVWKAARQMWSVTSKEYDKAGR